MTSRVAPSNFSWSYDATAAADLVTMPPSYRMTRAIRYATHRPAYGAVFAMEPGPARTIAADLDAAALAALLQKPDVHPVSISAFVESGVPRFTVLLEEAAAARNRASIDLDEAELRGLAGARHGIVDLATYVCDGARKFAVVFDERAEPNTLLVGIPPSELARAADRARASVVRLRGYTDGGKRLCAAVIERPKVDRARWYDGIAGDDAARELDRIDGYPLDLDIECSGHDVRFGVVVFPNAR